MPPSPKRPRGAPKGNLNALKHGFYTRRLKKRDLSGVESTDISSLIEEIGIIRLFTRRLIESIDPASDAYDLAVLLRALCMASSTITRIVKTQYLITGSGMDDEIAEAIKQVNAEFHARLFNPRSPEPSGPYSRPPVPTPGDEVSIVGNENAVATPAISNVP